MYFVIMFPCPYICMCPQPSFVLGVLDEASLAQNENLMVAVPQLNTITDLTVCTALDHHAYGASIATLLSRCIHIETLTIIVKAKVSFSLSFATIKLIM